MSRSQALPAKEHGGHWSYLEFPDVLEKAATAFLTEG
jgi:hypothetical protein